MYATRNIVACQFFNRLNFQIHANKFSDAALDTFLACTRLRCCQTGRQWEDDAADDYEEKIWTTPIVQDGDCKITTDAYGRVDEDFPDHSGIGSGNTEEGGGEQLSNGGD